MIGATPTSSKNRSVATPSRSLRVSSAEARFLYSASTGTNACENEPSANRRRSRFGMRKATKKASVARLAPKARAMMKSRREPRMRLRRVRLLTVARARRRLMLEFAPFPDPPLHGKHQVRPQARPPGSAAPHPQHGAAHHRAHRHQEREQGGRRR